MQIHERIKKTMEEHKKKIELTQWSVIAGVTSLVFSEYIRRIKHKTQPVQAVMVPEIHAVQELLRTDGPFMQRLSERLIDDIIADPLFQKYKEAPELVIFNDENVEVLKTIVDLRMIKAMSERIPETIALKFGLNNEEQQLIRQDRTIDLFERRELSDGMFDYITHQIVLQLLTMLPTMKRSVEIPEENIKIHVAENEILTIENENAVCPIHFDRQIIENEAVIELLSFITSSDIYTFNETAETRGVKNDSYILYSVRTGAFNRVHLTTLQGIETGEA